MRYTIKNVHIVRGDQKNAVSYDQWLRVENGKIAAIGSGEPELQAGEEIIDGKGRWLTPGMYNTHGHTPMALLRGVSDDVVLQEWLGKNIWPREALFDKEVSEAGTMLAQAEMIRSGTVAFQDMYHVDMDAVFQTAQVSGLKAVLARAMIGLVDEPEQQRRLDEAVYLGEKWDTEGGSRIKGMMFPHAPYTCPPDFMKKVVKAAHEKKWTLGIHLMETRREKADYEKENGVDLFNDLMNMGFFEEKTILTHTVHMSEKEMQLLKGKPAYISHNPMSNAKLGSGIMPMMQMKENGLAISIGTDSTVSNNNLDMFEEMRMAGFMQKASHENPAVISSEELYKMATKNGAETLGFENAGTVEPGADADFLFIHAEEIHLQPKQNIASHLVYAASGKDVTDVFVNGHRLMKDRELLTMDEEKIIYNVNRQFDKLEKVYQSRK